MLLVLNEKMKVKDMLSNLTNDFNKTLRIIFYQCIGGFTITVIIVLIWGYLYSNRIL